MLFGNVNLIFRDQMIERREASLTPRVLLALFGALPDDASVAVAEEPLGRRPDQLVAGGLLEGQATAELAAPLCNHGPALSCSDHRSPRGEG